MRKFIHSNFELDLSSYKITDTSENPWFSEAYFAKYSYPFDIQVKDDLDQAMGFITHYNSMDAETMYEGWYVHGDTMEWAVLEVEEITEAISVTLRYGLEDFPSFSKKLSELPLLRMNVANIYTHAAAVITQTWPNVNYNFPAVHTDKIDPSDSDVWFAFEQIINHYKNGAFLENTVDLTDETTYNRNIMQPMPYLLYVIKMGIQAAGYVLRGDILEDALLKQIVLYADTAYFTDISQDSLQISVMAPEYDTYVVDNPDYPHITLSKQIDITQPGKYRITGTARLRRRNWEMVYIGIKYRDQTLFSHAGLMQVEFYDFTIDVVFETLSDLQPNYLIVYQDGGFVADDIIFDLQVNPIRLHDDAGEAIPSILNLNQVDLTRAVPDMTFGDLMTFTLGLRKMDLTIVGSEVWINYINKEIHTKPVVNLSWKEVQYPNQKFIKGNSFLLKYQDVESEDYTYAEVFQSITGIFTTGFTTDDKTTEIILNGLPLPLMTRNAVQTAHAFQEDASKPFLVLYSGMTNSMNGTSDPAPLLIPNLHETSYKDWFAARLNSRTFKWTFIAWYEELLQLNSKSRVYAYGQNHLVKTISKTETLPDLFEVELETEVFE